MQKQQKWQQAEVPSLIQIPNAWFPKLLTVTSPFNLWDKMQELVETLHMGDRARSMQLLTWCRAAFVQLPVATNPCSMMGQAWVDVAPNIELMKYIAIVANELHNNSTPAMVPAPPTTIAPNISDLALAMLRANKNTREPSRFKLSEQQITGILWVNECGRLRSQDVIILPTA
jgi:hypothetical protein